MEKLIKEVKRDILTVETMRFFFFYNETCFVCIYIYILQSFIILLLKRKYGIICAGPKQILK